jgi:hypothetical protein
VPLHALPAGCPAPSRVLPTGAVDSAGRAPEPGMRRESLIPALSST